MAHLDISDCKIACEVQSFRCSSATDGNLAAGLIQISAPDYQNDGEKAYHSVLFEL